MKLNGQLMPTVNIGTINHRTTTRKLYPKVRKPIFTYERVRHFFSFFFFNDLFFISHIAIAIVLFMTY
ncbi:hypothetical protein K814_0124830 [Pseudomonas fluorescens LMG 5329]|uniref:Uncharacterized protein n=1 Tax=Pseudomonas fluorescens LMG 5329 TaxID=1324332 RepID=A0A0A1YTJ8_PSEFL|nr:hypothetical protein K814_0124830 [Pseudomonas fluorescens LMG 5329]